MTDPNDIATIAATMKARRDETLERMEEIYAQTVAIEREAEARVDALDRTHARLSDDVKGMGNALDALERIGRADRP